MTYIRAVLLFLGLLLWWNALSGAVCFARGRYEPWLVESGIKVIVCLAALGTLSLQLAGRP